MRTNVSVVEEGLLQEVPVRAAAGRVASRPLSARSLQRRGGDENDREQAGCHRCTRALLLF